MQECTLIYLYKPEEKKILLAMKKRRFGEGKWNGVGGKIEGTETIEESAVRETKEEICVDIKAEDLNRVATLQFLFKDNKEWDQISHVFFIEKWQGEPIETEEMKPEWHDIDTLPYHTMWIDDPHWLPRALKGEKLKAIFNYNKTGDEILEMKVDRC